MIAAIIARVNIQTNFPGDVTMLNMFINDKNKRRMLIPNAAKEYPIYGESGRNENNLSRQVDGAFAICYYSGCLLKYEKMLPFFLFWLLEPFDSMSEEVL